LFKRIVSAGVHSSSYEQGVRLLEALGNVIISTSQMQRFTERVGNEFATHTEKTEEAWEFPESSAALLGEVATISIDGGRAQVRSDAHGAGVHEACWRETKVACLQVLNSIEQDTDPHPELPIAFADKDIVSNLVSGLKREAKKTRDPDQPCNRNLQKKLKEVKQNHQSRARPVQRFSVADIRDVDSFGYRVLHKATFENLHRAKRKAFLADGDRKLWGVHAQYFKEGGWIPILDFIHGTEYAFEAAQCASDQQEEAWSRYIEFITAIWQGKVKEVIHAIETYIEQQKQIPHSDSKTINDRLQKLREIANYFENNAQRMNYPQYRRQGLPVSSCHVESLIKQFNFRVKSTEKFWNETSLKGMLHLKAATLSDDQSWTHFWDSRYEHHASSTRHYTRKAA